jgi:formylglycine-generating enzyme required for sulfatase activity
MLTPDGTIKLLDLGLARTIESTEGDVVTDSTVAANADLTDTKTRLGTENYMAPEQSAAPDKVDARADVFALGRTLGFLLTGTPQLSATGVPGGLFKVLQRLQAERPEDRMPTASAIAQALEPWARDHALEAMLGGRRRRSRRRVGAWVSVLALVVAAVSIAIAVLNRRHEPEAATTPIDQTPQAPREPPLAGRLGMSSDEAKKLQSQWAEFLGQNEAVAKVVEMKLNLIPPGRILQRTIDIPITKPYWLGTTEVTRGQFRVFVNATGYKTDAERGSGGSYFVAIRASKGKGMSVAKKSANRGITWERPGYENPSDEDPVTQVSWNDAVAFCRWLSESDGNRYRLPTLAESEWAARAGNPLTSPRDPDDANRPFELEKVAWTYLNSPLRPQPVAKLSPNDWGLYDTVGNISEWCQDWLYDQLKKAPTGVIPDYAGPDNGMFRILFGCDYTHRLGNLKYRNNRPDSQGSDLGFRVLREH